MAPGLSRRTALGTGVAAGLGAALPPAAAQAAPADGKGTSVGARPKATDPGAYITFRAFTLVRAGRAVPVLVTAPAQTPGGNTPRLEYDVTLLTPGEVTVWAHLSPRNPALGRPGLRYAVSFDDQPPQTVDVIAATGPDDGAMNHRWERHTSDHVNRTSTRHPIDRPGVHRLRFWMVDPTVVLQRLIVDTGGLCPRPASARRRATASADARNPGPPANTPAARQEPPPLNAPAAAITKGNRERPCSSTSAPPPPQPRWWSAAPC